MYGYGKKYNLKEAGYTSIKNISHGEYELTNDKGKKEIWFVNKNHASFGIKYRNTHLEFARSI